MPPSSAVPPQTAIAARRNETVRWDEGGNHSARRDLSAEDLSNASQRAEATVGGVTGVGETRGTVAVRTDGIAVVGSY